MLGIADLVEHASSVMTLHPGDLMFAELEGLASMTVAVSGGPGRKTSLEGMEPKAVAN